MWTCTPPHTYTPGPSTPLCSPAQWPIDILCESPLWIVHHMYNNVDWGTDDAPSYAAAGPQPVYRSPLPGHLLFHARRHGLLPPLPPFPPCGSLAPSRVADALGSSANEMDLRSARPHGLHR